jgi:hypothetical protein
MELQSRTIAALFPLARGDTNELSNENILEDNAITKEYPNFPKSYLFVLSHKLALRNLPFLKNNYRLLFYDCHKCA